ncbi:9398_t:CDS:2 [Diversispora eburnea]|uniref:9398_t:CDS:1 n=1 Tax=Diversispora eburnea TaxID=1213867 RepID=A0A9N8ZXD6_9GLOM|nr:9398_t:CDS:2 [Diversispora eburnea]
MRNSNRNTFHSSAFANSTNDNHSTTISPNILKSKSSLSQLSQLFQVSQLSIHKQHKKSNSLEETSDLSRQSTFIHQPIITPITREPAIPSDKIRNALLHRRMISFMGAPGSLYIPKDRFASEESPLEKPLNTFITTKRNEPIVSSPFDFRDLIDKYYEDSEEDDTDEDEHYGDDELDDEYTEEELNKVKKGETNENARKRINEEMISKIRKREAAVKEILTTEKTYINGLDKCVEYFLKPLRDKSNQKNSLLSKPIASMDELSSLFGNIETILSLHVQLLKSLEER